MSMMGRMCALSTVQIATLRVHPELVSAFASIATRDFGENRRREAMASMPPDIRELREAQYQAQLKAVMAGFPGWAEEAKAIEAARARVATLGPFQSLFSLEKSWHIFHYLFTGHADDEAAPGDALLSGTPIGETAGYGPARLHDERACRSFRDFLAPLDVDRLVTRMDFVRMASLGIYPLGGDMDPANEQSWRDEIAQRFPELKTYVDQASDRGDGLLIWID